MWPCVSYGVDISFDSFPLSSLKVTTHFFIFSSLINYWRTWTADIQKSDKRSWDGMRVNKVLYTRMRQKCFLGSPITFPFCLFRSIFPKRTETTRTANHRFRQIALFLAFPSKAKHDHEDLNSHVAVSCIKQIWSDSTIVGGDWSKGSGLPDGWFVAW